MRSANKFLIGMYGGFDERKFARDWRAGFYGIEACLFEREADIGRLTQAAEDGGFRIGIHFPLRAGRSKLRDALFLSLDPRLREQAYIYMQQELESAMAVRPAYVLFHYPKPVILDDNVDWSCWRFADASEYVLESRYPLNDLMELTGALFRWLSAKGEAYGFTPILEFDALNRYVYQTDFLEHLLREYRRIRLCLDTGRLHLQQCLDPNFDAGQVLWKYAPFADTVHLSNVQFQGGEARTSHYPALPGLNPTDGWAPIEQYLQIITKQNSSVRVVFEHRSDLVGDEQLDQCYSWIDSLFS